MPEDGAKNLTLADLLKAQGSIPESKLIPIFVQVLKDLEFNHSQAQIHLDIKPSRIVQSPDGSYILADYGISRIGTAKYMSPERAQRKHVDARSDIYSLGVVLFEASTGQLPFGGELNYEILDGHINRSPPLPRALKPELSGELQRIILTAMAKDPGDRFQSAREFREVLERVRPAAARPTPPKPVASVRASKSEPAPAMPAESEAPKGEGNEVPAEAPDVVTSAEEVERVPGVGGTQTPGRPPDRRRKKTEKRRRRRQERPPEREKRQVPEPAAAEPTGPASQSRESVPAAAPPAGKSVTRQRRSRVLLLVPAAVIIVGVVAVLALTTGGRRIPSLRGKTLTEAERILAAAGMTIVVAGERDDTMPANTILMQDPKPGSKAGKQDTVRVTLSSGFVVIPDLSSLEEGTARARLAALALRVGRVDSAYSDNHPVGSVMASLPSSGARVAPRSNVAVILAIGRATCPQCRANREPGARFCTSCGYRFEL